MKNISNYYVKDAKTATIGGREVALVYTDVAEEYNALRQDNGLIDRSGFSVIKVTGDGAAEFLDKLCTKDILYLNIDMMSECLMLDDDANALGSVWVIHAGDDFYVVSSYESADMINDWMNSHVEGEDVSLTDCSDLALVSMEGRKTWKIVRDVFDIDVDLLPLRGVQEVEDYKGYNFTVCRIGRTGEYGYMLLGEEDAIKQAIDDCMEYVSKQDMKLSFCGAEAEEICMLETRQPNFRYENSEVGSVFELCEQWFIQFEKEEYLGHESLMEKFGAENSKNSVCFVLDSDAELEIGSDVTLDGEKVGSVISAMVSPALSKTIGLALLDADYAVAGIALSIGENNLETVSSPIVRPKSWDEKME